MKDICIMIRGELLRNTESTFNYNIHFEEYRNKNIMQYDVSDASISRQNDIMQSIIDYIIIPYENAGYNVHVSGCVYECLDYDKQLKEFFPRNTIKQIKPGQTSQAEMFKMSIDHSEQEHPGCTEYISIRADYIMLKHVPIINSTHEETSICIGFAWKNRNLPQTDVFFIIPKNAISIFKIVLKEIKKKGTYVNTHKIHRLLSKKVKLYPIWNDYENHGVGIGYNEYVENKELHKNRPFVNYMRHR